MKCAHCGKEIDNELTMILINADGDFVCNQTCKEGYEKEKNYFFNEIVPSETKTLAWLMGEI